jgi:hypothetical protein
MLKDLYNFENTDICSNSNYEIRRLFKKIDYMYLNLADIYFFEKNSNIWVEFIR